MNNHNLLVVVTRVSVIRRPTHLPARLGGSGVTIVANNWPRSANRAQKALLLMGVHVQQNNQVLVCSPQERRSRCSVSAFFI